MPAHTQIPLDEYLGTDYSPDCDYIDGVLEERNVGENDHSFAQKQLLLYLSARERQWDVYVVQEQRIQVSPSRYRVPDLCVMPGGRPSEQVFSTPPVLCIEILSPEDRIARIQERIDDYLRFGVPTVWLIDPASKRGWIYTADSIAEARDGVLRAGAGIAVPLAEALAC
ncbi:MAG: Uma2 family endonuclease [Bryobacterales bacterium]|jgi:Uma2 family endonuclease|nr:Uma2 family endonuclease [Bryobacterales bacterium]